MKEKKEKPITIEEAEKKRIFWLLLMFPAQTFLTVLVCIEFPVFFRTTTGRILLTIIIVYGVFCCIMNFKYEKMLSKLKKQEKQKNNQDSQNLVKEENDDNCKNVS